LREISFEQFVTVEWLCAWTSRLVLKNLKRNSTLRDQHVTRSLQFVTSLFVSQLPAL